MLTSWKFWTVMAAILALTALLAFGFTRDPKVVESPLVGRPAPAFSLVEMNSGERLTSSQLKGTPYLLNFWASWCAACRSEAPYLEAAYERYDLGTGGRFRVIGVAIQDTLEDARAFAKRFGKQYFLALDNERGDLSLNFGLYGVPETFFVDAEGTIAFKQIGALTPEIIDEHAGRLLEAAAGNDATPPAAPPTE